MIYSFDKCAAARHPSACVDDDSRLGALYAQLSILTASLLATSELSLEYQGCSGTE